MKLKTKQLMSIEKPLTVRWLAMETEDFFTTGDAAKLLGVSSRNIRQLCSDHNLRLGTMTSDHQEFLAERKVIKAADYSTKLVPRETMDALVKIVNTPQAWSIWAQLLDAIRNPQANMELQYEIGGEDRLNEIIDEAHAVMQVRIDHKKIIKDAICSALRRHEVIPFDAKFFCGVFFNGTTNAVFKILNEKFAGELASGLSGKDFFAQVLNSENYKEVLEYLNTVEFDKAEMKNIRKAEKSRVNTLYELEKDIPFRAGGNS